MTLVELLIVIAVMVILLGLGLPLLKTGLAGRRIREASRQLNTYVEVAKSMAAETGRPAGLILPVKTVPENGLPFVTEVFLAQVPLPYAGDVVGARATISATGNGAAFNAAYSASLPVLIRPGDQIRFDYRGILHNIDTINGYAITFSGAPLPPSGATLPYQIYRQPEKSSSAPLQLAPGSAIDLSLSGFGLAGENIFDNGTVANVTTEVESVVILFNPSGAMIQVLVNKVVTDNNASPPTVTPVTVPYTPTDTLHLLVGDVENALLGDIVNVDITDDVVTNIENPEALWVSIGHQTGRVTTAENGWTKSAPMSMAVAREFAQSSKAMGGR